MAKPKEPRGFITYRAYFFRTQDPVIDEIRGEMQEHFGSRVITRKMMKEIEADGGPAATTVGAWLKRKTRRPQNATIEAAGRAIGKRRIWVDDKGKNGK